MGGWWRWALLSPDGVAPSRIVSVSASVNRQVHWKTVYTQKLHFTSNSNLIVIRSKMYSFCMYIVCYNAVVWVLEKATMKNHSSSFLWVFFGTTCLKRSCWKMTIKWFMCVYVWVAVCWAVSWRRYSLSWSPSPSHLCCHYSWHAAHIQWF